MFAAVAGLLVPPAAPVHAAVFNPNLIFTDAEMRDASSMSFLDIHTFLSAKGGLASQFDVDPVDGLLKGAAQLVDDAAKRYSINPRYVLAVLQKESSIVETQQPTQRQLDWAAGYALCDGCYKTSPLAQKYMGFGKQVDAAAGWMDWYMTNAADLTYLKQPGVTYVISSRSVTPANLATAGLYSYTPHIHGNKLLWSIMQRWWGEGEGGIQFPEGTLLRNAETGAVALIQGGKFRPVTSASVLETRFTGIVPVELGEYEFRLVEEASPGAPIRFADFSLVRTEDGTIYLLDGPTRRPISSMDVFSKIGFNPEEVEDVNASDIQDYTLGVPITLESAYPLGQLIQDSSTGGVYFVRDGVRHPIWDRSLLDANFAGRGMLQVHPDVLTGFADGEPVRFRDGTLVKSPNDPSVYVISDGLKRSIPSEEVFLGFGYRWTSIVTTSDRALTLHPDGEPLLLVDTSQVETTLAQ